MHDGVPRTIPSLAHFAAFDPDRPALRAKGETVGYGRFYDDLRRVIAAVSALNLPSKGFVAVEWGPVYRHWLLLLACESLGIATWSYAPEMRRQAVGAMLGHAAAVFHTGAAPPGGRGIVQDDGWWAGVLDAPGADPPPVGAPDAPIRIVCSSGTTGAPKFMAVTARAWAFQLDGAQGQLGIGADTRFLIGLGFSIQADYRRATACLRAGGLCIHEGPLRVAEAIRRADPTHVALMPVYLAELDRDPYGIAGLTVSAVGGRVPPELRARLLAGPAAAVIESYGTNETGSIATIGPDGVGAVMSGVTVEVVDDAGAALRLGETGLVRVRSPGTVSGYLMNPAATEDRFRDGWFYPGDLGVLDASRRLILKGRADDLLNIRGMKLNAPLYEDRLRAQPAIVDAGLIARPDETGLPALTVVYVPAAGADAAQARAQIQANVPTGIGPVVVLEADRLPRTETGKLRRAALTDAVNRASAVPIST